MFCIACGHPLLMYVQDVETAHGLLSIAMGTCFHEHCPLHGMTLSTESFTQLMSDTAMQSLYKVTVRFDLFTGEERQ